MVGIDPAKQIPEGLSQTENIWGYSRSEIVTVIACLFLGMLLTSFLPPSLETLGPFLLFGGFVFGVLLVFITPNHLEPTEWLGSMTHYFGRPKKVPHLSLTDELAREQKDSITETKIYELNERTQEITWVEKIHRNVDAVERIDGAFVGAIKVESANMALASDQSWQRMIDEWQSYLDHTLEYPVQIYATSKQFPVDDYIGHYQGRINDSDIQNRPILQELLRDFMSWYPQYLSYQGTRQKEYYLLFTVKRDEVIGSDMEQQTVTEQLMELPVIGDKIESIAGGSNEESTAVEAKMLAELDRRIREARNQGIRPLPGCSSRRISGFELSILLKEYWQGREIEMKDDSALTDTGASRRIDEAVQPEETATDTGYAGTN